MSILRKLLLPFSIAYGFVIWLRNVFYDSGILKSKSFPIPVICVGNLSMGGTGKTPMIEYLLRMQLPDIRTAVLSRGYGRKTNGFIILQDVDAASRVGDEPLQFKLKFPTAIIAVDEKRQRGITNLLASENPEVILLDDAFQHRKVKAGLNILLTSYDSLFSGDFMLPTGNLREPAKGAERANIIVVTKCPPQLSFEKQEVIRIKLNLKPHQTLYFSYIEYSDQLTNEVGTFPLEILSGKDNALVTGIAKPKPFCDYLTKKGINYTHLNFGDHHDFSKNELERFEHFDMLITTEKDFMRLRDKCQQTHLYYIPIEMKFLNKAEEFRKEINQFVLNEK